MKTKHLLIAFALLLCGQSYAQSGRELRGTVRDTLKQPLLGKVMLISGHDSTTIVTDIDGSFVFKSVKEVKTDLIVSSIGYQPLKRHYTFPVGNSTIDLENIILKPARHILKEVPIEGVKSSALKTDTLSSYSTAVFKVRENKSIDSLMKKMSSLEVDTDVSITHLGKKVTKLRINGKDYMQPKNGHDYVQGSVVEQDYGDQVNPVIAKKAPDTANVNPLLDSLLKKMQNYEVDSKGNLTINGKPVTKGRINGEGFRRGSVKDAIKNLPSDVVEKIQMIDDYGGTAPMSGSIVNAIPVIYKPDTIMFNVGEYKTKGNGKLIDLLKKLPGLDVYADESMTFQGKVIKKVSINDKEYVNDKLKKAMENLDADTVNAVLLIDDYGDLANRSSFQSSEHDKIMNIILK